MGKVFYDMGFLSFVEVIECSASDLIAQYVGQTGPKTRSFLEKTLGKVLFVDEAYRLGEGHFASEAINELVDIITKPKFFGKVVVILAGYDEDMNRLMAVNTGLSSRFSEEIIFRDMTPGHCVQLLDRDLQQKKINVTALRDHEMVGLLDTLSRLPFWGNARDVQTLVKAMVGSTFKAISWQSDKIDAPIICQRDVRSPWGMLLRSKMPELRFQPSHAHRRILTKRLLLIRRKGRRLHQ